MEKTLKVALTLAIAVLAVMVVASRATSTANRTVSASQAPASSAGVSNTPSVGYDPGCQDSAALVTGYDPITGLACPYP